MGLYKQIYLKCWLNSAHIENWWCSSSKSQRVTLNSKPICSTWRLPEKVSKHEISHIHSLIVATMTLCIKQIFSWTAEKCLFYWMKISRGRRRVTASPQHTKADSRTVIPYNVQDLLCSFNFNDENHLKMKFIIRFPN